MTLIFAHRGLHERERENTLGAFRAARALGVDGVELDVRRSVDGVLVVHHDATIAGRAVASTPAAELPAYVPTLAEALEASAGVVVNVEIKNLEHSSEPTYDATGGFARQVVDALRGAPAVLVSGFDLATCRAARAASHELAVGWLLGRGVDLDAALRVAADAGFTALNPHHRGVGASLVASAHELGLAVNVWTVNRSGDLATMLALGVDAIITDEPARALAMVIRPPRSPSELA
ncbi:MAG: glycerophosphodiester phosphodiesterase [Acidimicrobiales bacterium]